MYTSFLDMKPMKYHSGMLILDSQYIQLVIIRCWLCFIAPIKAGVYPLIKKPEFIEKAREVYYQLREKINVFYDESGSIGKRYARADEIGVPLGITIDGETLENNTVTVRFRDTKQQIRIKLDNLWEDIKKILEE